MTSPVLTWHPKWEQPSSWPHWPMTIEVSRAPFMYFGKFLRVKQTRFVVSYRCQEHSCGLILNYCSWADIYKAKDEMVTHLRSH